MNWEDFGKLATVIVFVIMVWEVIKMLCRIIWDHYEDAQTWRMFERMERVKKVTGEDK